MRLSELQQGLCNFKEFTGAPKHPYQSEVKMKFIFFVKRNNKMDGYEIDYQTKKGEIFD